MIRNLLLPGIALLLLEGCGATQSGALRWEFMDGPYAQNISAVLPDEKSPGTIFATLSSGDLFLSTNEGSSWTRLATVTQQRPIYRLLQDPERPEKLFATTAIGLLSSADRGRTWRDMRVGEPGTPVRALAIDPWSPSILFAGTEGKGLWKSSDAGASWTPTDDSTLAGADVRDIAIDVSRPDLLYAAVNSLGLLRSTDAGRTWSVMTVGFSATGSQITRILLKKNGSGTLLYGTNGGSILRSTNGGESWIPSRNGLEYDYVHSLAAHPLATEVVFAGTETGVVVSSDFGVSWNAGGVDLPKLAACVAIAPSSQARSLYAFGEGIGLRASTDNGASWKPADRHLGGSTVSTMTTDAAGTRFIAATGHTCLTPALEGSAAWTAAGTGIMGGKILSLAPDPADPASFFASTPVGAFQTLNGGASWQPVARTLRFPPTLYEPHPTIKTRVFATGEQGLFVSTDRGRTWIQARPITSKWQVTGFTFHPSNAGIITATTAHNGVIATHDGGFTWESARYGLPSGKIRAVTMDGKEGDILYAYAADGMCYRSMNSGLEWNRFAPPWRDTDSVRFAYDRYQPQSVIALVNNRDLYYSPSGGGTWFLAVTDEVGGDVVGLHWNAARGMAYAGTRDRGIFKIFLGTRIRERFGE
jgi:photosystem II stability/assembly factor-like uncharacterized protein